MRKQAQFCSVKSIPVCAKHLRPFQTLCTIHEILDVVYMTPNTGFDITCVLMIASGSKLVINTDVNTSAWKCLTTSIAHCYEILLQTAF